MLKCAEIFYEECIKAKNMIHSVNEDEKNDTVIFNTPWDGSDMSIFFSEEDGRRAELVTYLDNVPDEKLQDMYAVCNSLNSNFLWVKFFVNRNNTLIMKIDAFLSPDNVIPEMDRLLSARCGILKDTKPTIMRALYA